MRSPREPNLSGKVADRMSFAVAVAALVQSPPPPKVPVVSAHSPGTHYRVIRRIPLKVIRISLNEWANQSRVLCVHEKAAAIFPFRGCGRSGGARAELKHDGEHLGPMVKAWLMSPLSTVTGRSFTLMGLGSCCCVSSGHDEVCVSVRTPMKDLETELCVRAISDLSRFNGWEIDAICSS